MNIYLNYEVLSTLDNGFGVSIWADLLCYLAILSSLLVISTSNPVISVLFLISLFLNIAVYLILIGITYIGLTYIVVYIGAVTILFLFVIMLLDIKLSEIKLDSDKNSGFPLGMIIGISFLYPIMYNRFYLLSSNDPNNEGIYTNWLNLIIELNNKLTGFSLNSYLGEGRKSESIKDLNLNIFNTKELEGLNRLDGLNTSESLNKTISLIWDNNLYTYPQVTGIGNIFYTSYAIWFILIGIILLLAIVGAISLTLKSSK